MRCLECGRHNIIWKSRETVAFLLLIFKFLAICVRNYSFKSELCILPSQHCVLDNYHTLKMNWKIWLKNALTLH